MARPNQYEIEMYQRVSAVGASPFERISTLYLGSLRIGKQGLKAVLAGNAEYAEEKSQRLQAIIQRLDLSLDHDLAPDLCDNLSKLYRHMLARLMEDEVSTNAEIFQEVLQLLETLWTGFQEAQQSTDG